VPEVEELFKEMEELRLKIIKVQKELIQKLWLMNRMMSS